MKRDLPKPVMTDETLPECADKDMWSVLPDTSREIARKRMSLVQLVLDKVAKGHTRRYAAEWFIDAITAGRVSDYVANTAEALCRKGVTPSLATIQRWLNAYDKNGVIGLAPNFKGSEKTIYGWEVRAMRICQMPQKVAMATIAKWLNDEGHESATCSRVYHYLRDLPTNVGELNRRRLGPRLHDNTQRDYKRRDISKIKPGEVYQGDGHTIDVYLQHSTGTKPWRPELTAWIDVRSRKIVGWWISESESAFTTLFSLSTALIAHDHIALWLHIDNGAGFKNRMLSTEAIGFYDGLGMSVMHSRPYNAKGKGQIERFFGTMERDYGKSWFSYMGADMADEAIQDVLKKHKQGKLKLPTLDQWKDGFRTWLDRYHNTPQYGDGMDGRTPNEVWAGLEQHPVEPKSIAFFWPAKICTVRRECIRIDKREYMAPELVQYGGKKLRVEYSIHDDTHVRIIDNRGRWICDANLVKKVDYLPASRLEEAKQKRLAASIKRLEVHADEKRRRADLSITHVDQLDAVSELMGNSDPTLEDNQPEPQEPSNEFNLLETMLENVLEEDEEKNEASPIGIELTPFDDE